MKKTLVFILLLTTTLMFSKNDTIRVKDFLYKFELNRDYSAIGDSFTKNCVRTLDEIYVKKALVIQIEGEKVDVLEALIRSNKLVKIEPQIRRGEPNEHRRGVILWHDSYGIYFRKNLTDNFSQKTAGKNSSRTLLSHEILHGYNFVYDENYFKRRMNLNTQQQLMTRNGVNVSFPNKEEEYVTMLNNQVSRILGEDVRSNYSKKYYIQKK